MFSATIYAKKQSPNLASYAIFMTAPETWMPGTTEGLPPGSRGKFGHYSIDGVLGRDEDNG